LWFLVAVVVLAAAYVGTQLRRRVLASRFASAELLPLVAPRKPGSWRHVLAAAVAAGLVAVTLASARPARQERVARQSATVVLALDLSDSMAATDVAPSRIEAAKKAAAAFIAGLPAGFRLGLVSAGADGSLLVAPTLDHSRVQSALAGVHLAPGTALGDAIVTGINSIRALQSDPNAKAKAARIVLLSDGISTTGTTNDEAIAAATDAGVPVSTIAFGTSQATVQSQGQTVSVPVDKSALRQIANGTNGKFFEAASQGQLASVYARIGSEVTFVVEEHDLSEWFVGLALLVLFAATAISIMATSRPVQA